MTASLHIASLTLDTGSVDHLFFLRKAAVEAQHTGQGESSANATH